MLLQLDEDQRQFFEQMYESLIETQYDLDYYKAIVDGSWPMADEIIARKRRKETE